MINLILTTAAAHLQTYLSSRKEFRIIPLGKNKDGKNVFPDGEVFASLPNLLEEAASEGMAGKRFVVVHSGAPRPNDGLIELEAILAILKRSHVESEVFFTYMPYSMKDKVGGEGETNAAEDLLRKMAQWYQVKKIYALDPHFHDAPWLQGLPFVPVSAHELMLSAAREKYPDAVFVAPDKGHEKRTKELKGFEKKRTDSYTVAIADDTAALSGLTGKAVGVVDDIIETGGTMTAFHRIAHTYGPKELFAVATHGVLPSGISRISQAYGTLFLSNSVNQPEATVDIAPLIADALA